MDNDFLASIAAKHGPRPRPVLPQQLQQWVAGVLGLLFPEWAPPGTLAIADGEQVQGELARLREILVHVLNQAGKDRQLGRELAGQVFEGLEALYALAEGDLTARFTDKGSAHTKGGLCELYPEFQVLFTHRLLHSIYTADSKIGVALSALLPNKFNICIHASVQIGSGLLLQHVRDLTIGEGVSLGKRVVLHAGVSLLAGVGNKVYIEDRVSIHTGAQVLGSATVVGHDSVLGSYVTVDRSVLPYSRIFNQPQVLALSTSIKDPYSIERLIGNTPLVQVRTLFNKPNVRILAKLEGQNPGGSVKDRPAYNMIKQALKRGQISPGMKLIEPTSGNTGIALAMIACIFNLDIELVMPENSTLERVQTMEAYGAKVILTPAKGGIEGSRDYAQAQVAKGGYKMLNQFANSDNYMAHYHSTGPEIWRDTRGEVTHFVSSMGTTGTIMGTSMYLKEQNPGVQIVGVQPSEGAKIPGIRRWSPEYMPKIFNKDRVDMTIDVSEEESLTMMRRMAKEESIFAGMSSGGCMSAAIRLAQTLEEGTIVCIVCDRGDRYLSSNIFDTKNKV